MVPVPFAALASGLAAVLAAVRAQDPPPPARPAPGEVVAGPVAERIDSVLQRLAGFDYSGAVLIEREGAPILRRAYGFADRPARRVLEAGAIFDIGSLAKPFTATAVLALEAQSRLALSDPLRRFFPDAPADKAEITLAQLLTHTAGLAGDFPVSDPARGDYDDVDEETAVRRILAQPLEFRPGSSWAYSNCGYVLLASVVQRASGRDFREHVRETLFVPAGMRHTGFWGTAPGPERPVALGHDGFGNVLHDPGRMRATWYDLGGGEVWSTLDDLSAWIHALAGGAVLDPGAMLELLEPRTGQVSARDGASAYAWFVQRTPRGTRVIQHGGDYLGCGAELEWFVDEDVLLVTATNVRHDLYPTRNRVDRLLPGWIFEEAAPPDVPAFTVLDAPAPEGLEGAYRLASGGLLRLERIHGRLYLGAEGQDATDALAAAPPALAAEREWCSRAGLALVQAGLKGERAPVEAVLGAQPNPAFAGLLAEELADLVRPRGDVVGVTLLGTFASGWPRGNPPSTETTLVRLECTRGAFVYAIRWAGRVLAWTEEVRIPLACAVPLQLAADGSWVGWKILESQALRLRALEIDGAPALELEIGGRTLRARRG